MIFIQRLRQNHNWRRTACSRCKLSMPRRKRLCKSQNNSLNQHSKFNNPLIQIQEWKTSSFSQAESGGISWEEIDQNRVNTEGSQNSSIPTHAGINNPDEPLFGTPSLIGIGAGALALLILITVCFIYYRKKKKRKILKQKTLTRIEEEFSREVMNPYSSYSGYTVSV